MGLTLEIGFEALELTQERAEHALARRVTRIEAQRVLSALLRNRRRDAPRPTHGQRRELDRKSVV
jgi:hypothetical protein